MKELTQGITNPILNLPQTEPAGFLEKFIPMLVTISLIIASLVFFFTFLWGGIAWMTAGGDKAQVEAARSQITNAIIGLFIVFLIFVIAALIEGLLGIDILTIDIGKITLQ